MNLVQLQTTKEAIRQELNRLDAIKPACINCTNYAGGICSLANEAPPTPWVSGPVECESWQFDGVPF